MDSGIAYISLHATNTAQENTVNEQQERIAALIAEFLGVLTEQVKAETSLDALGADSLDKVELVMELEHQFSIEISDERGERLGTVGDVFALVAELTGAA